jgi:uncharacterized delta-60 repeat protein
VNVNGSPDTGFNISATNPVSVASVSCVKVQPDGKIILAGGFTRLSLGVQRNNIARLNPDGSPDFGFYPKPNGYVRFVEIQPDGKILLSGSFHSLQPNGAPSPTTRNYVARLNPDGSLDTGFDPNPDFEVHCMVVQPDGKILLGGFFYSLQPNGAPNATSRYNIARVNSDGSLDTGFDPHVLGEVHSMALQTDGKILIGGLFIGLQPNGSATVTTRNYLARLNADGSLDPNFDPNPNSVVDSVTLQADGKILIGGEFYKFRPNGAASSVYRAYVARLHNDRATRSLSAPDATRVLWQRGGTSPEVSHVTFEYSTDGHSIWTPLGSGNRVGKSGDWETTGLALPSSGYLRARGRTGNGSGGSWFVETVVSYPETALQAWNQTWFGNQGGTGIAASDADPNNNAIPNLLEYALGGDPVGHTTSTSIMPRATVNPTTGRMELNFTRYPDRNDITFTLQTADDPAALWEGFASSVNGAPFTIGTAGYEVTETGDGVTRSVTISEMPAAGTTRRFMRVKVTVP